MEESVKDNADDEISLIDLFAVIWHRKRLIIALTLAAAIGAVSVSVISLVLPPEKSFMPNEYSPKALMLINDAKSSGGGLSSLLSSSGLGGLAGLAGVSVGGGQTYSSLAQYLVSTNTFLDAVVDKFDLITRYKIERFPRAGSRKALKKILLAEYDEKSGVLSISFTDIDPAFAQEVVNFSVGYLEDWFQEFGFDKNALQQANLEQNIENTFNDIRQLEEQNHQLERTVSGGGRSGALPSIMLESQRLALELSAKQEIYRQLKVQLELTNVAIASETPIFQVIESAEVPDQKSKPSRGLICIIVTFAGFFLSVFLAFVLNAVANIKQDPEAMAKLRSPKKDNAGSSSER
jgi:uncharacterized protein involved in exopolysaccharide biosynthesis